MLNREDLKEIIAMVARHDAAVKLLKSHPPVATYEKAQRERSVLARALIDKGVNLNG